MGVDFESAIDQLVLTCVCLCHCSPQEELRKDAMDAICALAVAMGSDFAIFIPSIRKLLHKHRLTVSASTTRQSIYSVNDYYHRSFASAQGPFGHRENEHQRPSSMSHPQY
jgi:hypothetical protein